MEVFIHFLKFNMSNMANHFGAAPHCISYPKNNQQLRAICCVMERWIVEKSSLGEDEDDAPPTESTVEDARHLLNYCQNYDL